MRVMRPTMIVRVTKQKIDNLFVLEMKQNAARGYWEGKGLTPYFELCFRYDPITGTRLGFTRDVGYHSCGWFKNPDYERCFHLSLSFVDPVTEEPRPKDEKLTLRWLEAFFGASKKWLWCEPPYTEEGKLDGVWHYRLFCDPGWQPIKPRGEVYSTEFTEKGWKSFSELVYEREK